MQCDRRSRSEQTYQAGAADVTFAALTMSMSISRHQAGATIAGEKTGGQFKASKRTSADGAALMGGEGVCAIHGNEPLFRSPEYASQSRDGCTCPVASVEHIETMPEALNWVERDVLLTPRHRNPQDITREAEVSAAFRSVSREDTGEAFTVAPQDYEAQDGVPPQEYRHFDGELYTPLRLTDVQSCRGDERQFEHLEATPDRLADLAVRHHRGFGHEFGSVEELSDSVQKNADQYLVIDDRLWKRSSEPIYTVSTFGTGHNHGGTGFMVSDSSREPSYDGRIRKDNVFTMDEFDAAKAYALKVARGRGDTESAASIERRTPHLTLSPNRPWSHPVPPKRLTGLTRPYDIDWEKREDYATYERVLRDMKVKIAQEAPEAIYTDEQGRRRVDFSLLTEGAQEDYATFVKKTHELRAPLADEF